MGAPESYREQSGCRDCARRFERHEYDSYIMLYCTYAAPPRPKCGSSMMDERFGRAGGTIMSPWNTEQAVSEKKAWDEWAKDRCVSPFGICDHWQLER